MIRAHENPIALRAGALSVLVHGVLLALLLVSFNWKTVQPLNIAEVELWDSLPSPVPVIEPKPEPEPPKPEPVIEPKPEPKPVIESKPEPEPKAEIQLKKEPVKEIVKPPKVEKPKPDPTIKAKEAEKKRKEELKKLQQMIAAEDQQQRHQSEKSETETAADKAAQAALAGEVSKYAAKVKNKIYGHVNRQVCGTEKVTLTFSMTLLPTGDLMSGSLKRTKSSGIAPCDEAVERAILQSDPLPQPPPDIFNQVRDLEIIFRPNADN